MPRSEIWRRWRSTALWLALAGVPLGVVLLGLGATCRPAWYAPPAVDVGRLRDDKAALLDIENRISAALNAGRAVRIEVTAAQVNRWLAAREEFQPFAQLNFGPLERPMVDMHRGALHVAATVPWRGARPVAQFAVRPVLTAEALQLEIVGVRLGTIPIPRTWIAAALDAAGQNGGQRSGATLILPRTGTWPNGKCPFRLREVTVGEGALTFVLEPLGR